MAKERKNSNIEEKKEVKEKKNNTLEEENKEVFKGKNPSRKSGEGADAEYDTDVKDVEEEENVEEETEESVKDEKEERIIELESRLDELSDRHLRLQAEYDNFRRRTLREKADLIKSCGESVLTGILPIIDDFERAIDSMEEISDDESAKQGTLLIYSKFKDFLKQNNVKEIEALHKDFDVDHHEALTKIPVDDKKLKGKVVEVIQKGYILSDKVIRFAKVVVGE
jgi:molecular chaperone GrpE